MMNSGEQDRFEIRELVDRWAVWRDAGDWERFATVWDPVSSWMTATWFQGSAPEFIEASKRAFERGVLILHTLTGHASDVEGDRAIGQTKMTITQRGTVHGVTVDVVCTGRFYDFLGRRDGAWRLVRRQPIYERDRIDVVTPGQPLDLDQGTLGQFPLGYRHLAYLQTAAGFDVKHGLPGLTGPEAQVTQALYAEGRQWLAGSDQPGRPL
jgi:hypothetical protein